MAFAARTVLSRAVSVAGRTAGPAALVVTRSVSSQATVKLMAAAPHLAAVGAPVRAAGMAAAGAAAIAVLMGSGAVAHAVGIFELSEIDNMREHPEKFPRADSLKAVEALAAQDSESPDLMWRLARAKFDVATETPGIAKETAKKLIEDAYALVTKARHLDKNNGDIHRWCGLVLNALGDYQSTKESIGNSYQVRSYWEEAIEVNPSDASAQHLLGRWSYEVASLSWVKRKLAATLFATPPSATYGEALDYFNNAERIAPGFWKMNQVMLCKTHDKLGNKEEAVAWARKALAIPVVSEDDRKAHAEAEAYLKANPAPKQ